MPIKVSALPELTSVPPAGDFLYLIDGGVSKKIQFGNLTNGLAPSARRINSGSGLSGGGDLTADRTLAVDGTVVRTTRQIITSGGIVGGGDLSADRTLSLGTVPIAALGNGVTTVRPTSITGNQNNYVPAGGGLAGNTIELWSGAANATFTGLSSAGVTTGQVYLFKNTGSFVAFFTHNSGSSSAGNKFFNIVTTGLTGVALGGFICYVYDGTQWQLIGHEQGAFITHTFNAGEFTADNGATWTVTAGEVNEHSYRLSGRNLFVKFHFGTIASPTQITVAAANNLFWVIAGGYTAAGGTVLNSCGISNDGTQVDDLIQYAGGSTQITFSKVTVASFPIGGVRLFGSFFCEVS